MKPSSLFGLLFLFAFFTSSSEAQLVTDTNGDPLRNGGAYHIVPYILQLGGGMELGMTGNETCPVSVVRAPQLPLYPNRGLPWKIWTPAKILYMPEGIWTGFDTIHVEGKVPNCVPMPSGWSIVEGEDGEKTVKISGVYENSVKGVFMIKRYNPISHKIVFCPSDGDSCEDIGFSRDGRGLAIAPGMPQGFVFKKAESSSPSIIANI